MRSHEIAGRRGEGHPVAGDSASCAGCQGKRAFLPGILRDEGQDALRGPGLRGHQDPIYLLLREEGCSRAKPGKGCGMAGRMDHPLRPLDDHRILQGGADEGHRAIRGVTECIQNVFGVTAKDNSTWGNYLALELEENHGTESWTLQQPIITHRNTMWKRRKQ